MEETMKKNLSLLAAFLVVGFCAAPASAADHYISGMAGITWMNDVNFEDNDSSLDFSYEADMSSGLALLGAVGCDYGDYRLEAEIGYQKNDTSALTVNGVDFITDMKGDGSILSLMANAAYDIDLGGGVEFYPTVGIGIAQVSFNDFQNAALPEDYDFNETTLAYQIGAGLAVPIGSGVMIDARYRYFATTDFTVPATGLIVDGYEASVSSHSALLGLRVGF